MRKLVEHFVRYPSLANIVIAFTLIAGLASLFNTKKSFFPSRNPRNITIQVAYPGASPEEMEEGVTLKIEEAIYSIVGIDEITSTSSENSATVLIETLKGYDIDEVYTEIKNAIDRINSFPVSMEKPIIFKEKPQSTAQWVAVYGSVDLYTLKKFSEEIEEDLRATGVISQIEISGYNDREISIEVTEENLSRYQLTFDQVANAVRFNNRDISAGSIKASDEEILIRSNAKQTEAERIGEIVLRSDTNGNKLLLRDVADIKEKWADIPNKATYNGKQSVWIEVRKLETEDLEEISSIVENYVQEFNESHDSVQMAVSYNFLDMLQQRLDMLVDNGAIGLLLVMISLGLFLSLRLSAWVAWGIPSSFLGLFIVGTFVGLTINMISLFGMILVIGILVDDGIVIAENIYTHFERHHNPAKAAIEGTMEVLPAVFTSVTTTIVAFTPLLLLTGGFEFLKDMAVVVIVCLAFSLLEAFFVLPAHLASRKVLSIKTKGTLSHKIRSRINGFIDRVKNNVYGRMLQFTMKYRIVSAAVVIASFLIVGGLMGGGFIKSTFFPNIPFDAFSVNIAFKPGTREQKVEEYIKRFDKAVWEVNEDLKKKYDDPEDYVTTTFSTVGSTMDGQESGSHAGGLQVFYRELDDTPINSYELLDLVREKIGKVPEAEKFNVGGGDNRFGKPVAIRLKGRNIEELNEAKNFLKKELENISDLRDIQDNVALGRREVMFELSPEAYFLGFTHNDITKQVRQGYFGEEVQRLQKGKDEVRVWVRYPKSNRANMGQLEDMKIKGEDGKQYPLSEFTTYTIERGIAGIKHFNTIRTVTVDAELIDPYAEVPPIITNIQKDIIPKLTASYPGIKIDFGGQSEESQKSQAEIGLYFGGAFILIFFIIMVTFKSFYQGILIMMMIPLGWMGAAIGHGIEGIAVSLLSAWGMIALSGVIINDAVVFLAKFNSNLKGGMKVYDAAYDAGLSRFRPIILTSITTVAGLYPLILENSFQAQFLIPMAVSVAYGVLIGTFFILLFFPVLILIFNDIRIGITWFSRWLSWLWTPSYQVVKEDGSIEEVKRNVHKPTREEVEQVIIDLERNKEFEEAN
ncbi:efflux RND transporter permease subunit [Rapidithrix thailandica]|uniref:Efflux RND transporter permease subunit n=1 Tax=Rapidithrix thailandica TaxID=413964 RepID=A0AAW9S5N9_9BACT